jgi:hypothetical protein
MSDNPFTDMHTLAKNSLRGQAEQINLYAIREQGLSSLVERHKAFCLGTEGIVENVW